jgi:hydroxyacylglutathione hydrolase
MALFRRKPPVPTTDVAGALQLLASGALLVDVREEREYAAGHAPGAVNLPLSRLRKGRESLPEGRDVVVMCRSGHRSAMAARSLGSDARVATNLAGGIIAWTAAGEPVLPGVPTP